MPTNKTVKAKILTELNQAGRPRLSKSQLMERLGYCDNTLRGRLSELSRAGLLEGGSACGVPYRLTGAGIVAASRVR